MALPSSGPLGIGQIRAELSSSSGSLRTLSSLAGKSTPDAISEFYGYSAGDADFLLNLEAGNSSSYPGSGTTWYDISGSGNHATLTNKYASNPAWNSSYFTFTPSNVYGTYQYGSYVSTPDYAFSRVQSQNRVTLSVWVYPTENSYPMIIAGNSYNGGIPGWQGYQIWLYSGNLYGRITVNNTTTYTDIAAGASYYSWNHCVLTYDGTYARFYLNNSLISTNYVGGTISNIAPNRFLIGAQYNAQGGTNTAEFFAGNISKVRLYSRVISDSERTTIYNSGS